MDGLLVAHTDAQAPTWHHLPALQRPAYPDEAAFADMVADPRCRSLLVFAEEVDSLRDLIAQANTGEVFVLMGGNCAESFIHDMAGSVRLKVQTILQMAAILTYGASTPTVKIGRMAGQYAKLRSSDTKAHDEVTLPAFRGDPANGHEFTPEAHILDPTRMLDAYLRSGTTLNLIRALTMDSYASLCEVYSWDRDLAANPIYKRFESFAEELDWTMRFMETVGVDLKALRRVNFHAIHEALLLEHGDAMIREDPRSGHLYDTSAHMLWVGEHTRRADGAHVAILADAHDPVGVEVDPTTSPDDLPRLMGRLNLEGLPGRLSLITCMGADHICEALPSLVEAVYVDGRPVAQIADPMHGNTITSDSGYKTRHFEMILDKIRGFFEVHYTPGAAPGGAHVEFTGDDATEVLGDGEHIDEASLAEHYETLVDPRLSHQQPLEIAFEIARMLKG